jgi:hypothetical protein
MKKFLNALVSALNPGSLTMLILTLTQAPVFASAVVGRWNLGENDPGAASQGPGNAVTAASVGGSDLNLQAGAPTYSSDVPAGGSTLSMLFGGPGSGDWYSSDMFPAITNMDQNNLSVSFDAKPTDSPNGYSTAMCIGRYGHNAAFIFVNQTGVWTYYVNGVGAVISGAGPGLGQWQHIEFKRVAGVNSLLINGTQVGATNTTAFGSHDPYFSIGAPRNGADASDIGGCFVGYIDNVSLSDLSVGEPPQISAAPSVSPGKVYDGNSIILTAVGVTGDSAGRAYLWRNDGMVFTNTGNSEVLFINHVNASFSGPYDLVVTNNYGSATSAVAVVAVLPSGGADVMRLRMGDDDPGATFGNSGNSQTIDAVLGNNLDATGTPSYSSVVPGGGGSLSMAFDGGSYYRKTNLTTFFANLDQANYGLSFDTYCYAFGGGGFSFPLSMGRNGGGIGIVEIAGMWNLIRPGVGTTPLTPVQLNTWTHFEIQRRDFDTAPRIRVFINGQDFGIQATTYSIAAPILTVGANTVEDGEGTEGLFNGLVDNVVIHNYSIGGLPTITSGPTAAPGTTLLPGEALTLSVSMSGGTPASYLWRRDGIVLTNELAGTASTLLIPNPLAGNYDVIISNSPAGVITSSIVAITIGARTESAFIATFNLGEQDPGAATGTPGKLVTRQLDGIKDLNAAGTPRYTNSVPAGGSTLSIAFGGDGYYWGAGARWAAFCMDVLDTNNCMLSCDVYPTALGAAGFSFPVSIGANGGGIAIVEIAGHWHVIHQGVTASDPGPAVTLHTWTHLELVRKDMGSGTATRLLVDGLDSGISIAAPPRPFQPFFTIAANAKGDGTYEGFFRGLVDNVQVSVLPGGPPTLSIGSFGTPVAIDCSGSPGSKYRLLRATSPSPASWTEITSAHLDSTGYFQFTDDNPPAGTAFYRAVSP